MPSLDIARARQTPYSTRKSRWNTRALRIGRQQEFETARIVSSRVRWLHE